MSNGLRVWDALGNILLDTSTIAGRLIDTFDVAAGVSGSKTDSRYSGAVVMAVCLSNYTYRHHVTLSGTTLSYSAVTIAGLSSTSGTSRIYVFMHS